MSDTDSITPECDRTFPAALTDTVTLGVRPAATAFVSVRTGQPRLSHSSALTLARRISGFTKPVFTASASSHRANIGVVISGVPPTGLSGGASGGAGGLLLFWRGT
ncbi:hypothetical protein MTO96_020045 [Rhipicephalus appendiculatus]